jgi:methyl-accepting chemotaxis protein
MEHSNTDLINQLQVLSLQLWALSGITAILFGGFIWWVKKWIEGIESTFKRIENDRNNDKINYVSNTDFKKMEHNFENFQEEFRKDILQLREDSGRRKGSVELVEKDVENLRKEMSLNFDSIKIHLNYQKETLSKIEQNIKRD